MDEDQEAIAPAERARERRRDRDAEARERSGMRTGLAKQFKQVLDAQRKRAEEAGPRPSTSEDLAAGDGEDSRRRGRHRAK